MFEAFFQRRWLPAAATAALAGTCVFLLPYAVPPHPAYSESYVVGFNNRIAIASVLVISLAVYAVTVLRRLRSLAPDTTNKPRLRWPIFVTAACTVAIWIGALSLICLKENTRVAEDRYFLTQLEKVALMHRTLYTQVEFAYGPLLFYPTLWIAHLFHGLQALDRAYYLTLVAHQVVGIGMLWFTLNQLPLTRAIRLSTFIALTLYALNPWMGLNYTLVRFFAVPFAIAVLVSLRGPFRPAIPAFCAPLLGFAISPESGIAITVGAVVFGAWSAFLAGERYLLICGAALAGIGTAFAFAPRGLLSGLYHFSNGFHQTVLLPSPAVLLVLAAAVWFGPRVVARAFNSRSTTFPLLAGIYFASLAALPVTFATMDTMHLLSNGLGLLLLGAVFVSGFPLRERFWIVVCPAIFLLFFLQCLIAVRFGFASYIGCVDPNHHIASLAASVNPRLGRIALHGEDRGCPPPIAPDALPASSAQEGFTIVSGGDSHLLQKLVRLPQYRPVYFANQTNVWNVAAQQILVSQLREVQWLIGPNYTSAHPVLPGLDNPLDFHPHFRERHTIATDDLIAAEIATSWRPVAQLAPSLWLYQRTR